MIILLAYLIPLLVLAFMAVKVTLHRRSICRASEASENARREWWADQAAKKALRGQINAERV